MNWRPWLELWSEEWIAGREPDELDPEVVRQRWLGYAPAAEADIAAVERRLGLRLPPSYRSFLLTTDGWRHAGEFVRKMRDTTTLGWLRDLEPTWESWADLITEPPVDAPGNPFGRGLLISLHADVGVLFLDPADRDENGEWAAYSVFSWGEFPQRYPSFTALMESQYQSLHRLRQPAGDTRDEWDLVTEQARGEALSGDVDTAMAALEKAPTATGHSTPRYERRSRNTIPTRRRCGMRSRPRWRTGSPVRRITSPRSHCSPTRCRRTASPRNAGARC